LECELGELEKKNFFIDLDSQCNMTIFGMFENGVHQIWQDKDDFMYDYASAYEWGSWYVHEPQTSTEIICASLFDLAEFIVSSMFGIWPFLINIVLLVIVILYIFKYIKAFSKRQKCVLIIAMGIVIMITILSLDTLMFLPHFWV